MLKNQIRPAIVVTLVLMVITGLLYPGAVTGVAQLLFPHQANGSLIWADPGAPPRGQPTEPGDRRIIGSELIGQQFTRAEFFHARPSAAGNGYDDTLSAGTNKGPTDLKLADTLIAQAVDSAVRLDGAVKGRVPADYVTRSGSGLDPHISPASALLQVERVARARSLTPDEVRALVAAHTEGRQLGFLGEPRVNVLRLNLSLDSLAVR